MLKASRFRSIKGSSTLYQRLPIQLETAKQRSLEMDLCYHPTGNELSHQKQCKTALTETHPGKEKCKHSAGKDHLRLRNADTCIGAAAADGKHSPAASWEGSMESVPALSCLITVDSLENLSMDRLCSAPPCDPSSSEAQTAALLCSCEHFVILKEDLQGMR